MLRVQESNLLFPLCGEMTDSLTRIPEWNQDCHLPPPVRFVNPCRWSVNISYCLLFGGRLNIFQSHLLRWLYKLHLHG